VISKGTNNKFSDVQTTLNQCISAFENVSDDIEYWEVKYTKSHKLYKEYDVAIKLAKMILRRYSFNIHNVENGKQEETVPVFWIDMSLLYEHYVLGLLRETYGNKIIYQAEGITGYPDFLFIKGDEKLIMDTKYIPRLIDKNIDTYIIRQLSGYARDCEILGKLKLQEPYPIVPCVIIYPKEANEDKPIIAFAKDKTIISQSKPVDDVVKFYKLCVELPTK
jgi:5-methylcytosine-specific restriction enzyme subunit McrC